MMKYLFASAALLEAVLAFPTIMDKSAMNKRTGSQSCSVSSACNTPLDISNEMIGYDPNNPTAAQQASAARNGGGNLTPVTQFNLEDQYVSTTGQYQFISPSTSDIRGPCPGLNAAANHAYLSRSGVTSITESITGLAAAYGMSNDLAGFLAAYAVAIDGDPVTQTWSIGGPPPSAGLNSGAQGISYSHNKYEGDTSISRCDAYTNNGDAHSLSTTRFQYAYDACESGAQAGRCTMDKWSQVFAMNTFRSIAQNAYYFAPLFSTTLVSPAAYNFVVAMMSNHTAEYQDGYLDGDVFKSFFSVTGDSGSFVWQPGQDRIPDNWYRRPEAQPYTAHTGVFGDLISEFTAYPTSFRFGGNTNGPNTYTGIDISNFTGGAYSADTLFQGNNLECFLYQNIQQGLPDSGSVSQGLAGGVLAPFLGPALGDVASCPALQTQDDNDLPSYPGREYQPTAAVGTNC